ncbi:DUF397 domain-containing protein [Streptomyces sp. NPDC053253]|uniref:DUF397 domain-containing protein n=1 Tax=Streptomyces sp. NPDC053253 TaxID=3365699 RepID=UPI0037D841B3
MSTFTQDASTLRVTWRKSSYSGANSNCVEAGRISGSTVVRDSKAASGPALHFTDRVWQGFVSGLKAPASE